MTETKKLIISKKDAEIINRHLEPKTEDDYQGEDYAISYTVVFSDGAEADFKCCGCNDESSWLEMVLFKNGSEVSCTEPYYEIEGTEFDVSGNKYIVEVETE